MSVFGGERGTEENVAERGVGGKEAGGVGKGDVAGEGSGELG